jgi:hypothetical protein
MEDIMILKQILKKDLPKVYIIDTEGLYIDSEGDCDYNKEVWRLPRTRQELLDALACCHGIYYFKFKRRYYKDINHRL